LSWGVVAGLLLFSSAELIVDCLVGQKQVGDWIEIGEGAKMATWKMRSRRGENGEESQGQRNSEARKMPR